MFGEGEGEGVGEGKGVAEGGCSLKWQAARGVYHGSLKWQAARGGSRFIGRHLHGMAGAVGFQSLELEAVLSASDTHGAGARAFAAHLDPSRYEVLRNEGLLSAAELERVRAQLHTFLSDPSAIVMLINVLLLGTKPAVHAAVPSPALPSPAPSVESQAIPSAEIRAVSPHDRAMESDEPPCAGT